MNAKDTMAEPIPKDLAKAFDQAVLAYELWHPTNQGQLILIAGHYCTIGRVCDLVSEFVDDQLPEHVLERLRSYMHDQPHGAQKAKLLESPTYGVGAICLREIMDLRRR
jgi:hypothetical protein